MWIKFLKSYKFSYRYIDMCKYFILGYFGLYWIFCIIGVGVFSEFWGWFSLWGEIVGFDGVFIGWGIIIG